MANDSDSSPPQSRGRGRFEKSRTKVASRGQSEETRSTSSSQAADEEGSSHVNALIGLKRSVGLVCVILVEILTGVVGFSGTGRHFVPAKETVASAVASATLVRKKTKQGECCTRITPRKWLHTTSAW